MYLGTECGLVAWMKGTGAIGGSVGTCIYSNSIVLIQSHLQGYPSPRNDIEAVLQRHGVETLR
jgi:hypothetical protein